MTERIVFPDIEKTLVEFLTTELTTLHDTAKVVTKVPDPRPARMVRVVRNDRRIRMDREDREGRRGASLAMDRPRVVFECSDDSGSGAELLALVRAIVTAAAPGYLGTVWCDYIEDAGEDNITETATAAPRHAFIADMIVRGKVLA
ncbi:hypothetical protein [Nocardia sp. NPDC052566]|uniref:hypothetical protein n=1 Tax=Nocardia sp. NPDC052566 TaxID=3364330 RepID=UPI0037C728AC